MMNRSIRRPIVLIVAALALGTLAWTGGSVRAAATAKVAPPASPMIAIVDVEKVMNGLTEMKDRQSALQAASGERQKTIDKIVDEGKNKEKELETMAEGSAKVDARRYLAELRFRAQTELEVGQRVIASLKGEMFREVYLKVNAAAKATGKANGYHLVLSTDEGVDVPNGTDTEVARVIALKRMLYVDPTMDVTQELITFMNNEYAAGGKKK